MKKSLSILLAVLMLVGIFAAVPVTAGAATISKIDVIGVFSPAAGAYPDYTADVNSYNCKVDSIYWYDCTNNIWINDSTKFVEGNEYQVNVHVKADSGSGFATPDSSVSATVNSKKAQVSHVTLEDPEEYLNISYNFTARAADTEIDTVTLNGVTEPEAGKTAKKTYNNNSTYYTVKAFEWRLPDDSSISSGYVFQTDSTYQARFYLAPKEGYRFGGSVKGTINGYNATVRNTAGRAYYEYICVTYNYTTGSEMNITKIDFTDIVAPKAGESPKYTYKTASEGFTVEEVNWYCDGNKVSASDKFEVGKTYNINIKLKAKSGYRFSVDYYDMNDYTATVNGKNAEVNTITLDNPDEITRIRYTFPTVQKPSEVTDWSDWEVTRKATASEDGEMTRHSKSNPSITETKPIAMISSATIDKWKLTYTGKAVKPAVAVKDADGKKLVNGTDYVVAYPKAPINTGVYAAEVVYIGNYTGSDSVEYIITSAKNPMTVKPVTKSVKAAKLKKAKQTVKNAITVKKPQGTVTYARVKKGSSSSLTVSKKGVITVKKGSYKKNKVLRINVKVTAKGNKNYSKLSKTVTVKIKIK